MPVPFILMHLYFIALGEGTGLIDCNLEASFSSASPTLITTYSISQLRREIRTELEGERYLEGAFGESLHLHFMLCKPSPFLNQTSGWVKTVCSIPDK